jgi:hypothetical protein
VGKVHFHVSTGNTPVLSPRGAPTSSSFTPCRCRRWWAQVAAAWSPPCNQRLLLGEYLIHPVNSATVAVADTSTCTSHPLTLCIQVLLNAFGRALKDSFPPARCAALRAMSATIRYYSPEEIACRALPAVCPLCVDQLPGVIHCWFRWVKVQHCTVAAGTVRAVPEPSVQQPWCVLPTHHARCSGTQELCNQHIIDAIQQALVTEAAHSLGVCFQ